METATVLESLIITVDREVEALVEPMTADVLRRAAARPDAPPRLIRAADAVMDGQFTWEEAASGKCEHPLARALHSGRARATVWPLLAEVASEPAARPPPEDADDRPERPRFDGDDFSYRTYLQDWDF